MPMFNQSSVSKAGFGPGAVFDDFGSAESAQIGNSIVAGSGIDFMRVACWLTKGKLTSGKNAGVSGNTSAQMLARWGDVPAAAQNAQIMEGANDADAGVTTKAHIDNIFGLAYKYMERKQVPMIVLPPPRTSAPVAISKYRIATWMRARTEKINAYDPWRKHFDATTGGWVSGASSDGVHPVDAAVNECGATYADDILALRLAAPLPVWNSEAAGLLANCLFLTDTNADGVPDGWSKNGPGTGTITSGSSDGVAGNWMQLTGAGGFSYIEASIANTNFSVGDTVVFCCKLKYEHATNGQASFNLRMNGAQSYFMVENAKTSLAVSEFVREVVVTTTDSIQIQLQVNGAGTGHKISVGQVQVYNKTRLLA